MAVKEGWRGRFFEDFVVGDLPGDELPLIKTLGIVQQGFDLGNNDTLTEFINITMILLPDILYDIIQNAFFFF